MDKFLTDQALGDGKIIQRVIAALPNVEQIAVDFTVTEPRKAFCIRRDTTFRPEQQSSWTTWCNS